MNLDQWIMIHLILEPSILLSGKHPCCHEKNHDLLDSQSICACMNHNTFNDQSVHVAMNPDHDSLDAWNIHAAMNDAQLIMTHSMFKTSMSLWDLINESWIIWCSKHPCWHESWPVKCCYESGSNNYSTRPCLHESRSLNQDSFEAKSMYTPMSSAKWITFRRHPISGTGSIRRVKIFISFESDTAAAGRRLIREDFSFVK